MCWWGRSWVPKTWSEALTGVWLVWREIKTGTWSSRNQSARAKTTRTSECIYYTDSQNDVAVSREKTSLNTVELMRKWWTGVQVRSSSRREREPRPQPHRERLFNRTPGLFRFRAAQFDSTVWKRRCHRKLMCDLFLPNRSWWNTLTMPLTRATCGWHWTPWRYISL